MVDCVIAEDEELLRTSLLLQLGEAWPGLRIVAECEDGASALEASAEHRPDVAFLDIRMPGLTGIEVAAALGEVSPHTLRQYGLGAQILSTLGLHELILLTNSAPLKVIGLDAYGLSIAETRPITKE